MLNSCDAGFMLLGKLAASGVGVYLGRVFAAVARLACNITYDLCFDAGLYMAFWVQGSLAHKEAPVWSKTHGSAYPSA